MKTSRFALILLLLCAAQASAKNLLDALGMGGSVTAELERTVKVRLEEYVAHADRLVDAVGLEVPAAENRRIRDGLVKMFAHARLEKVSLSGPSPSGYLGGLWLDFRGVEIAGLKVDLLRVDLRGLKVDVPALMKDGRVKIEKEAQIELTLRLRQEEVSRTSPYYRMTFTKGDLGVVGERDLGICDARIEMHGNLVGTANNQLIFRPRSLAVGGITVPRMLYARTVEKSNPLVDFTRSLGGARGALDVQCDAAVECEPGYVDIKLRGTLRAGQRAIVPDKRQASAATGAWAWQ